MYPCLGRQGQQQRQKTWTGFYNWLGFLCVCIGSGLECYYRVHDGLHSARQAHCKCLLQNVYIYKYVAGYKLLARFQTRALYEDPSPLYVHCPGLQAIYKTSNYFIFAFFIVLDYICLKLLLLLFYFIFLLGKFRRTGFFFFWQILIFPQKKIGKYFLEKCVFLV